MQKTQCRRSPFWSLSQINNINRTSKEEQRLSKAQNAVFCRSKSMLVSPCVLKHVTCRLITWWLTPVKGNYNWTNSTLITGVNYNPLTILGGEPPSAQPLNTSKPNRPPPSMLTRFAASSQRVISGFPDSRSCTIRCQWDNPWVQASDIWREFFNQDTAMFGIFGWVYFEKHVFFNWLRTAMWCVCLPFGEAILRHDYPHKERQNHSRVVDRSST